MNFDHDQTQSGITSRYDQIRVLFALLLYFSFCQPERDHCFNGVSTASVEVLFVYGGSSYKISHGL